MKLAVIALDYDGTIAIDGTLDSSVREAIGAARQKGIIVVLVTGRRLDDLRRVAGELDCFDALVVENGAVLHFPDSGRHVALAHAAPRRVIDELARHGVPKDGARCVPPERHCDRMVPTAGLKACTTPH